MLLLVQSCLKEKYKKGKYIINTYEYTINKKLMGSTFKCLHPYLEVILTFGGWTADNISVII